MTYTIIYKGEVWHSNNFDAFESYRTGMVVIDMVNNVFTSDGLNWNEIKAIIPHEA